MDWLELLMIMGTWGVLGAIVVFITSQLFGGRPIVMTSLIVFALGFMARALVIILNEEWQFFEPKFAGNFSLTLYRDYVLQGRDWTGFLDQEFAPQVLLNIPVWMIYGESRFALLMSNAAVGALAAPLAAILLIRDHHTSVANRALVLLSLYPAGFNFSVFGLRDPIIFVGMLVLIIGAIRIWSDKLTLANLFLMGMGAVVTLNSRPELAYIAFCVVMLPVMNIYVNLVLSSLRNRRALASLMILTLPIIALGMGTVFVATGLAARNIGARTMNPAEIASNNAVERFERHDASKGGGSHMISGDVYRVLPWYLRVPVQTVGLIMLPFPWAVSSVPHLLAFGDSLYIIAIGAYALLNAAYAEPLRKAGVGRLTMFLMFIAFVGFLGLGFVISNFGNGFRMRLAVTPALILAASVCPVRVRFVISSKSRSYMSPAVS